jgi:hypothetical protein
MFNPLVSSSCFTAPEYLSGKSGWIRHIPIAFSLIEALRPSVFVELGTHHGDSYCAFCQAVSSLETQTKCFAVDSWKGDEQAGFYGPDVLAKLREYHDPKYGDFSTLIQSEFDAARSRFAYGSIDLLHIDGFHTYEAVKHDFETWLPAVSDRGVIVLHDTRVHQNGFGVWRFWEELSARYDHFEMQHAYGLGVIAVGHDLPDAFKSLLAAARTTPGFDPFFNAQGQRLELSARITQQQEHIAQLEKHRVAEESQVAELKVEIDRQAQKSAAEAQAAELKTELELQVQRAAAEAQVAEVKLELERQIQRAAAESQATELRVAEAKLEMERQSQQMLVEQMNRSFGGWQARIDALQRLIEQVHAVQHEFRPRQDAVQTQLQNIRGDLGQLIAHLGQLQLVVEDQRQILEVVNHWSKSKPYRLVRDLYRPLARFCNRLRGKRNQPKPPDRLKISSSETDPAASDESRRNAA